MKYRKKPDVVDAFLLWSDTGNEPEWVKTLLNSGQLRLNPQTCLTQTGCKDWVAGDWLVREANGHLWIVDSAYFHQMYEAENGET